MGNIDAFNAPLPCWSEPYASIAAAKGSAPELRRFEGLKAPLDGPLPPLDADPFGEVCVRCCEMAILNAVKSA